jgi:hypothetical protein
MAHNNRRFSWQPELNGYLKLPPNRPGGIRVNLKAHNHGFSKGPNTRYNYASVFLGVKFSINWLLQPLFFIF